MKPILFDTSILVAGFVTTHPSHSQAFKWLKRAVTEKLAWAISSHSLAECYAVLTRLPLTPKITPTIAKSMIEENIEKHATIVALSAKDYLQVISEASISGLSGGILYDALSVKAAKKIKAQHILTLNTRDFLRLCDQDNKYVIHPNSHI